MFKIWGQTAEIHLLDSTSGQSVGFGSINLQTCKGNLHVVLLSFLVVSIIYCKPWHVWGLSFLIVSFGGSNLI